MIKVITCHHYRHDLAELFYLGIERLKKTLDIQVYCAITKGDLKSIEIAERYDAMYVEVPNEPLGKKWNEAYRLAWNGDSQAKILILGEDNLMSDEILINTLAPYNFVIGLKSCAIVDTHSKEVRDWSYKDDLQLIGAGRLFHQPPAFVHGKSVRPIKIGSYQFHLNCSVPMGEGVMNDNGRNIVNPERIVALWDDNLSSGLDRSSEANLALLGYSSWQYSDHRIHVIDFKSSANIHKFNNFGGCPIYSGDWSWFLSDREKIYLNNVFGFKLEI